MIRVEWLDHYPPGLQALSAEEWEAITHFSFLWTMFEARVLEARDSARGITEGRCCMKDLLRVGRFGPPFSSPQEPHCRDAVEGSSHV